MQSSITRGLFKHTFQHHLEIALTSTADQNLQHQRPHEQTPKLTLKSWKLVLGGLNPLLHDKGGLSQLQYWLRASLLFV